MSAITIIVLSLMTSMPPKDKTICEITAKALIRLSIDSKEPHNIDCDLEEIKRYLVNCRRVTK